MKIKKLIKLLECIEGDYNGKLPKDMYHLGTYTKESGTWEAIAEMDFVHVMRSFKKAINYDKALEVSVSQTNQITKLEQEVSHLREKLVSEERARIMRIKDLKSINHDIFKKFNDLKERNAYLQERVEELIPVKAYPKYDFCEVPNDCDGQRFIDDIKKYLNTNKYKVRVRGQHIKEEYKGTGATAYGQSIEQSTHLRVYIEEK